MNILQFVIAGCLVVLSTADTPAEIEAFYQLLDGCVAQEGASEAERNSVVQRVPPTTPGGYCLFTCVMENLGVIKDGRLSVDGSIALTVRRTKNDEMKVAAAKAVAEDCADVTAEKRCDLSIEIMKCTTNSLATRGLDINILD